MRRQTRIFPTLFILVLGITSAGPCFGQAPGSKKHTLPDFDIREGAAQQASAGAEQSREKATVELRRANNESFLARERAARPGIRIVPNQYGFPKLLLRDGGTLSAASTLEPEENAKNFLRAHSSIFPFAPAEVDNLRLIVKDVTGDATFLAFNQTIDGIDVFNGQIKVTMTKAGEVVQVATADVIPDLHIPEFSFAAKPRLSHEEGILTALRVSGSKAPASALSRIPDPNGRVAFRNPHGARYSPITSELVIFPLDGASARLAYRIFVDTDPQSWYEILIDAESGAMLFRQNLYRPIGRGNVWLQSPLVGSRQMVAFPDGWLPASPNGANNTGWVTTGNNVDAFVDANGDDKPDSVDGNGMQGGRAYDPSAVFDFPFGDGTVSQDPRNFKAAAVTNLFYFINTAHDYYYGLGFNEAAGNFQTDNFGKGGLGNDAVVAEAQQGNETGNAAFASTPDGTAPHVRVGLETLGTSTLLDDLDYDYDSQSLVHEYGHGVSNRLVGSRISTSCLQKIQSRAMGEGWSDYFAISFSNNPVFGAYGGSPATGDRRQSYEGYTLTYEDIGSGNFGYEQHDDGEVWTATLWDLRKSLGQSVTDRLVVNGLKSTPCGPSMTDGRDAILSADQATNGGANRAKIWQVFAKHGLGYSASGTDGTFQTGTVYDAAYDQPPDLQGLKNPSITSKPLTISASLGSAYSYTVTAANPNAGTLSFALTSGPAGMTIDPVSGKVAWVGSFTGQRVKITVTDGKGGKVVHGYELPVYTPITLGNTITIGGSTNTTGYASVTIPSGATVLQVTTRGGTGDADLFVKDPAGNYEFSVRIGNNETLSYALPMPGVWQVEVDGYVTYSGVSLTASLVTPSPLSPNTTVSNLSAVLSSETLYVVTIPVGATSFTISTSGGTGDVDLYLRKGIPALCQASLLISQLCYYDRSSDEVGNFESITVGNPDAGDWYVDLSAYNDYSGVTLTTALTAPATLLVSPSSLAFTAVEGGTSPAPQNLAVSNPAAAVYNWTAQATASTGGNWLSIDKTSGGGDATIKASASTTGMKAGTYQGTVTVTAPGLAGSPQRIPVTFTVSAGPVGPVIASVNNAASYASNAISPGEIVAIFGAGLGPAQLVSLTLTSDGLVSNQLAGTTVQFNGIAAPMIYTSATVVAAVVPYGVTGNNAQVTVTYQGTTSAPLSVPVAGSVPGIFTANASGSGQASASNQNGTINSAGQPAPIGSVVTLYATGEGQTSPGGIDGKPVGVPLPHPILPVSVTIGGVDADVQYKGGAPGLVAGVMQLNVIVPAGVSGPAVPVVLRVGTAQSQAATTIAVPGSGPLFTVTNQLTTGAVVTDSGGNPVCGATPAPKSSFLSTDPSVYVWLSFNGIGIGDVLTYNWIHPSGTVDANHPTWTSNTSGSGCAASPFAIAGQQPVREPGNWQVRVSRNGTQLFALPFTITAVVTTPTLTLLNPSSATALSSNVSLNVSGTGFTSSSVVQWSRNGQTTSLTTTFGSSTALMAQIPANLLTTQGTAQVTVVNGTGTPSNALTFTITAPVVTAPTVSSLSPSSIYGRTGSFRLLVKGAGFASDTVVQWNRSPLPTTVLSSTQLLASVSNDLTISQGTVSITVSSGGQTSAATSLPINAAPSVQLADQRVTNTGPLPTLCPTTPPPSVSTFSTRDVLVYLFFRGTVTSRDFLTDEWLGPDGTVVPDVVWFPADGNFCFDAGSLNVSSLLPSQLGTWEARVYDNGTMLFSIPFSVHSGPTAAPQSESRDLEKR